MRLLLTVKLFIYIDGDGLKFGLGFGFQARWLHCTVQKLFPLHRLTTQIPTPYLFVGQESESESVPVSESGNVNEPFKDQTDPHFPVS